MTAVVNQVEMPLYVDPHPLVAAAATFFRESDLSPAYLFCIIILSLPLTVTLLKLKM